MRLFADAADLGELRELKDMGIITGVTTNPSIAGKIGGNYSEHLAKICELFPEYPVFSQVTEKTSDKMVEQGKVISSIADNMVVKVPVTKEGIKAIYKLKELGKQVCATTILTSGQAYLAAMAGADYAAPYVGEWDIVGYKGMEALEEIVDMYKAPEIHTKILAAGVMNTQQLVDVARRGTDIVTITYKTIMSVCDMIQPTLDIYLDRFMNDWEAGKTYFG